MPAHKKKTKKKTVTLSIDETVFTEARAVFTLLGQPMSAFVEQQLAAFVEFTRDIEPLLNRTDVSRSEAVAAMHGMMDATLGATGSANAFMTELVKELRHMEKEESVNTKSSD